MSLFSREGRSVPCSHCNSGWAVPKWMYMQVYPGAESQISSFCSTDNRDCPLDLGR